MNLSTRILLAGSAMAACLPASTSAQPGRRPAPSAATSALASVDKGWDGTVKGKQILAPLEIRFDRPSDYDAFAAGQLPIYLTLSNAASGQIRRFTPAQLLEGFRRSDDRSRIVLYILVSDIVAPAWDADGCVGTTTTADNAPGGNGVSISVTVSPCEMAERSAGNPIGGLTVKGGHNPSAQRTSGQPIGGIIVKSGSNPSPQRTAGAPIGGLIVKGGKNPGGNMIVIPAPSDLGIDEEAMLRTRAAGAGMATVIIVRSEKGAGSPKAAGF